ncbi:MAG TPA: hypothetical protein V6C90_29055, partial [Coleofasciculaceae cyanobacterium]
LAGKSKFALKVVLDQLELLDLLSFRPEYVQVGISILQTELDRFEEAVAHQTDYEPSQVLLFCGHMIDNIVKSEWERGREGEGEKI